MSIYPDWLLGATLAAESSPLYGPTITVVLEAPMLRTDIFTQELKVSLNEQVLEVSLC